MNCPYCETEMVMDNYYVDQDDGTSAWYTCPQCNAWMTIVTQPGDRVTADEKQRFYDFAGFTPEQ